MTLVAALVVGLTATLVGLAAANSGGGSHEQPPAKTRVIKRRAILSPGAKARYWTPERMNDARPDPMSVPGSEITPRFDRPGVHSGGTVNGSPPRGR